MSLYDVSRLHRMVIASILGVNRYTYLIPVSFLGLQLADFSNIEEVRGEKNWLPLGSYSCGEKKLVGGIYRTNLQNYYSCGLKS